LTIPSEWEHALGDLVNARAVMVIGAADAGKTTLTTWLANVLHARGFTVAIIDADLGQSEIGPPMTVGLGAVRGALTRSGDAEPVTFEFVGTASPARQPWRTADATGRLVARARPGFERIVIDTSGFVAGGLAAAIKQRKISAADPDLVVLVQASTECEHVVRDLVTRTRPRVLRLPAVLGGRRRTPVARRRHREEAVARHLTGARAITLDLGRVAVRSLAGEPVTLDTLVPGAVVALHAVGGEPLALGVVAGSDPTARTLTVASTCSAREVVLVTVGETTAASA
jgi:polynucleotide 5'-hydroxyl-kinase GRC3/NOL9